ncbi:MAG: hypothetical protein M1538_01105 [Candidatus Marsarchaeota archaeon]|nr:hypothetical protein [Candidatus Marsarchaeota archaeon]
MVEDVRSLARRRTLVFFAAFLLIAMLFDTIAELDVVSHAVDEIGLVILSAIMLLYILISRSKKSTKDFATQRLVLLCFIILMIAVQVYGLFVEAGTNDFGDDIPVLIGLVLMLINLLV